MKRQDQFIVSTVVKFLRDHWISLDGVTCQILMDPSQSKTQLVEILVALLEGLGVTFVQGNPDLATVIKDGGTLLVVGTPKIRDKLNSLIVDKDFISTISEVSEQKAVNGQNAVHRIMIPLLLHDELSLCFPDHPYFQQVLDFNVELFGEVFYKSLKRLLCRFRDSLDQQALDTYFRELVEPLKSHSNNMSCSSRDYYFNATMFNLTSISRTAINGVIDPPVDGELGAEEIELSKFFHTNFPSTKEEVLRLVLENFKRALNIVISKAEEMKHNPKSLDDIDFTNFIRVLALTVNDNIIETKYLLRNYNYKGFPYTKSSLLYTLFSDFCSEFMSKAQELSNFEDKKERRRVAIEFSAWIEYRLNLTAHFFCDGCSRVALLLSVFVFMLADCEVPIIINGANYFKNLPTKVRSNLCEAQDQVQYSNWLKHYSSFFRLPLTVSIHDISNEFTSEGELMEYYQTVGLDNLHVISKSSSGATGYTAYEGKKEVLTGDHLSVSRKSGAVFSNFIGVMQYFRQEAVPKLEQCFSECKDRGNDEVINISALEQCFDELIEGIVSRVLKSRKLPLDGREIRNYFRRKDSKYNSIDHQKLDEKYDSFLRELSQRLLKPNNYDIIETIALIDYRISFHYHFFLDGNIRIAQALILLICMFLKIRAPEFSEGMSRKRFAPRFPISADNYYEDEQFQFWSRYYRSLYGSSVTPYHGEFEVCLDREGLQITDFRKIYLSLEGSTLKYRTIWAVNPEYLQHYDENTDALIKAIEEDKLDRISLSLFNWLMRTLIERKHLADAKITATIENVSYYKVCIDSVAYPADSNTIYLSSHDSKLFYRTTEVDGRYALDCPEDDPSFNERIICLIDEKRIYDITLNCIERLVQTLTLKGHLMDIKSPAGLYSFTLSTDNDLDSIVDDSSLILLSCDHQNLFYRTACTDERQVLDPSNNNPILGHICWTLRYHLQINTLKDIPLSCFTWLVRLILEKNHLMDSKSFSNPWNVAWKNIAPEESTIFQNISRSAKEINILMNATGDSIKNMVVFNPTRMALHRGIIYVITRYNHELARKERLEEILKQMLADSTVSSSLRHLTMDFETAKEELGIYVHNHVFTDYFGMLKDQDLINFISNTRDKITKRVASGKCHIRPSQSRDIMKQLVIDKLLRDDFEKKIEVVIDRYFSGETFFTAYKEYKLSYMPNFERIAWAIVGGPASGKTSLVHFVNRQIQTSDYCVVNPDNYKHLLHTESVTSLKKNYAMLVHEESSFIADKILNELKSMVERDCAPNILLDTVKSSEEKMKVIGYGGATVFLNIASCPVEGETGALARAYKRASTKGEDFGRFVPTEEVLAGHKKESDILPETIRDFRVNLRLFDTSTGKKPRLTAVIDTHDKNMKVYYLPGFISFIKKGLINVKATNESQAYYTNLDGKELARLLSEYIVKGISLIFLKDKATLAIMDRNGGIICNNYPLFRKEFDFFRQNTFVDDLLSYFITQPLVVMSNETHKIFLNIFIYDNTGSCILKRSPETGHKVMCSMKLKNLSHQIFNLVQPAALPPVPQIEGFHNILGGSNLHILQQQLNEIIKNPNIVAPVTNNPQTTEFLRITQNVMDLAPPELVQFAESMAKQFVGQNR